MQAFEFGLDEDVFVVNFATTFVTKWKTFVANVESFTPWHDLSIVVRRDSHQFVQMLEDLSWICRGIRPAISGLDSKRFTRNDPG